MLSKLEKAQFYHDNALNEDSQTAEISNDIALVIQYSEWQYSLPFIYAYLNLDKFLLSCLNDTPKRNFWIAEVTLSKEILKLYVTNKDMAEQQNVWSNFGSISQ